MALGTAAVVTALGGRNKGAALALTAFAGVAAAGLMRGSLEDAPRGSETFKHKTDGCVRAVFAP